MAASDTTDHRFGFAPLYRWGGLAVSAVLLFLAIGKQGSDLAVQNGPLLFLGAITGAISLGMWASSYVWVTGSSMIVRRLIATVDIDISTVAKLTITSSTVVVHTEDGHSHQIILRMMSASDRTAFVELLSRICPSEPSDHQSHQR